MAKRVYFAFHYQDVIDFRANVVRNHNFTGGVESAGYYDHSIWEEAKKKNPIGLKRMINSELEGTSVTVVLIGSQTFERKWVRYEIFKSIEKGNKVLGIHINQIKGKDQKTKESGPNPFDHLGLAFNAAGDRVWPIEFSGAVWRDYQELEGWSLGTDWSQFGGKRLKLTHWLNTYDWVHNNGFNNFANWIA